MAKVKKTSPSWATQLFWLVLLITVVVYVLRGFAILTMLPGGILWILILLTIVTGILALLVNSRRRY